jgi:hypothetical protein
MLLTKDQMIEAVLKALDDAVAKEFPEDQREEAKARLLNAWSGQMFTMGMKDK